MLCGCLVLHYFIIGCFSGFTELIICSEDVLDCESYAKLPSFFHFYHILTANETFESYIFVYGPGATTRFVISNPKDDPFYEININLESIDSRYEGTFDIITLPNGAGNHPTTFNLFFNEGLICYIFLTNTKLKLNTQNAEINVYFDDEKSTIVADPKNMFIRCYLAYKKDFYLDTNVIHIYENRFIIDETTYVIPTNVEFEVIGLQIVNCFASNSTSKENKVLKLILHEGSLDVLLNLDFNISFQGNISVLFEFQGNENQQNQQNQQNQNNQNNRNDKIRPIYSFFERNNNFTLLNEPNNISIGIYRIKDDQKFVNPIKYYIYQSWIFSHLIVIHLTKLDNLYRDSLLYKSNPKEVSNVFDDINKKSSEDGTITFDIYMCSDIILPDLIHITTYPKNCRIISFVNTEYFKTISFNIYVEKQFRIKNIIIIESIIAFFGADIAIIEGGITMMGNSKIEGNVLLQNASPSCSMIETFYGISIDNFHMSSPVINAETANFYYLKNGYRIEKGEMIRECVLDVSRLNVRNYLIDIEFLNDCNINLILEDKTSASLIFTNFSVIAKKDNININFKIDTKSWEGFIILDPVYIQINGKPDQFTFDYQTLTDKGLFFVDGNTNQIYNKNGEFDPSATSDAVITLSATSATSNDDKDTDTDGGKRNEQQKIGIYVGTSLAVLLAFSAVLIIYLKMKTKAKIGKLSMDEIGNL